MAAAGRDHRREAAAAEVVGALFMLAITVAMFLLLANAVHEQMRRSGDYIRNLVPGPDESPDRAGVCLAVEDDRWCREEPGQELPESKRCIVDSIGWPWCLKKPELPDAPPLP